MNARHDASYKHLFSSPKVVQHLIEGFLPAKGLGRLEGEALLLQRMLTRRFGPLPEWVQTRLHSASSEELETWAERVVVTTCLGEMRAARLPSRQPHLRRSTPGVRKRTMRRYSHTYSAANPSVKPISTYVCRQKSTAGITEAEHSSHK